MRVPSATERLVKAAGAALGALASALALWVQQPRNLCTDSGLSGIEGPFCTIMMVDPAPIWAWATAGALGAVAGWLIADLGLWALRRRG